MLSKEEQEKLHFLMNGPDDIARQMAYTSILKAEHREKARIFEAKAEGIAEGKAEGIALGKAEGIAVGKVEGKAEGKAELKIHIATKMKKINSNKNKEI